MTLDASAVKERLDERAIEAVLRRLGVERFASYGPQNWLVSAPNRTDVHPSLSIHRDTGVWNDKALDESGDIFDSVQRTVGGSFPDAVAFVADAAGISVNGRTPNARPHRVATYHYEDETCAPLFRVDRMSDKTFYPRQPSGSTGYGDRRVLYHLPEIVNAGERKVLLVEGEKDADRLRHAGLIATTSPGGANAWRDDYAESLRDRNVVIIPDNDEPGFRFAVTAARSLVGVAAEVRVLDELPGLGTRLPKNGRDVSDWLDDGHDVDELKHLILDTPPWVPNEEREEEGGASRFTFYTIDGLRNRPPQRYLIDEIIVSGALTELYGAPGSFKSFLALDWALSVASGLPWHGRPVEQGPARAKAG